MEKYQDNYSRDETYDPATYIAPVHSHGSMPRKGSQTEQTMRSPQKFDLISHNGSNVSHNGSNVSQNGFDLMFSNGQDFDEHDSFGHITQNGRQMYVDQTFIQLGQNGPSENFLTQMVLDQNGQDINSKQSFSQLSQRGKNLSPQASYGQMGQEVSPERSIVQSGQFGGQSSQGRPFNHKGQPRQGFSPERSFTQTGQHGQQLSLQHSTTQMAPNVYQIDSRHNFDRLMQQKQFDPLTQNDHQRAPPRMEFYENHDWNSPISPPFHHYNVIESRSHSNNDPVLNYGHFYQNGGLNITDNPMGYDDIPDNSPALVRELQEKLNEKFTLGNGRNDFTSNGSGIKPGHNGVYYPPPKNGIGQLSNQTAPNLIPAHLSDKDSNEDMQDNCALMEALLCCHGNRDNFEGERDDQRVNLGQSGFTGRDGEEISNSDYLKSLWIHCRLPLLILLVTALVIVFLLFSGALIYLKYNPYKTGFGYEEEPCEETSCAFGAMCSVENGRAVCNCPESCPSNYDPICGTDDISYSNECLLRMYSCQNQKSVRIRHSGECDTPDPCASKVCHYGSRCIPTLDGRYAICDCPTSCPESSHNSEASQAVCASDGKLYRNKCELDKEACRLRRNITARYKGKCDPCEDILCSSPQVCHLDEERRPICRCGEVCTMEFNPVCGSDGKTYANECVMRMEACRTLTELRIIYRGKCSSGVNPCESRTCRGYESCAINRFGIAQCTCAMTCQPIVQPVCGSDGKTYDNYCELTYASCREARHITLDYRGTCEAASACAKHSCPPEATCVEKSGSVVCECPVCPSDYEPVCGSDGVSYQNHCRLRMEACLTNTHIKKMYAGLCNLIRDFNRADGCEQMQCDFYSVCQASMEEAKCICPENCTVSSSLSPVCGTDGLTYHSECQLQKSACRQQKFVMVASKGHCDMCANVQCKFGAKCENGTCICPTDCPANREPVCGSNLVTYSNECELQKAACALSRPLSIHFYGICSNGLVSLRTDGPNPFGMWKFDGVSPTQPMSEGSLKLGETSFSSSSDREAASLGFSSESSNQQEELHRQCEKIRCDFGAVCELAGDSFPRCSCQFNCSSAVASPVCGSNLKLYKTECEMRREACQRQIELRPRPMELCEDEDRWPSTSTSRSTSEVINCKHSTHGCCLDGLTPALGENQLGCPSAICQCNKLGSVSETCDLVTHECQCRRGVGGPKCDRCLPGFWGLTISSENGNLQGCNQCGCSRFGSVREDCEQMTGRCVCKSGVLGHKCDSCSEGEYLGPYGCTRDSLNLGRSCVEITCNFGAECEQDGDRAGCICNIQCPDLPENEEVCASDGFTYESECLVGRQSCRSQKHIFVIHKGKCPASAESFGTESPLLHWTGLHFTEPGDDGSDSGLTNDDGADRRNGQAWTDKAGMGFSSSGMKSTRHLPPQSSHHEPNHRHFYTNRAPTAATIQMRSYLGDSCQWTGDCQTTNSICLGGWCICKQGFYEDSDRIQCKAIHSHLSEGIVSCTKSFQICQPPATCFDHRNGSHTCICPFGRSNANRGCSAKEQLYPFFNGRSTISLDKLAGYHKLSLELEITPYLNFQHGILIFSSQHANSSGDFLSLALVDGFVEFRYDLGDGPAILRSSTRVLSGQTHHIMAKRYNRDGLLRLDEEHDVKATSPGTMKSLNLDHQGYIGFVPLNSTKVWELVGTAEGFIGCIHKLRVGRRPIEFEDRKDPLIRSTSGVLQCPVNNGRSGSSLSTTPIYTLFEEEQDQQQTSLNHNNLIQPLFPLSSSSSGSQIVAGSGSPKINVCSTITNPCQNHGICWNDRSNPTGYKCVCHPEFSGPNCESRSSRIFESGAMLDFRGFSYLELPCVENGARHVSIEIWFMLRNSNGLLFYNGQEMGKGDFITIILTNGFVQFLFDLGSGMANITSTQPISLNKWHWLVVNRDGREASIQIDGQTPIMGKSPPTLSELNLELPLYVGGIRDLNMVHRELGLLSPFDGVLQLVVVNGQTYHRQISTSLRQRLVHRYEGPPCGTSVSPPCQNKGTCFPRLESFVCLCQAQFQGKTCENPKETPGPVRFDGQSYIKFPRKIAKHESFNFTDYDDFYNDNFDSQLDELFGQSSLINSMVETSEELDNEEYFINEEYEDEYDFEEVLDLLEFIPISEHEVLQRSKAQRRNRIELVFRTSSQSSGLILWTGRNSRPSSGSRSRKGYLGLFLVDGHVELRVDLGAGRHKKPTVIRSKVKVDDGRWHQVLLARQKRLIVLQVDGAIPQRATAPPGSNVLVSDGRYWIGGTIPSYLPAEIPSSLHQGLVGCVDLVRIEKRRLPLSKFAYSTGIPLCDDDD